MGNKGSISVDLPALKTQAESAKSAAKAASEAISNYEKASQSLTSSSLTGQTYDAAKQYCSGPFKTLLTGTKNFYEEASAACEKLVNQYESMVDTKSWDSEELKRLIQSANQAIQNHQSAMRKIQKKKTLTPHLIDAKNKHTASIAGHQALKQKYEKILKGLEQFSQQSASYFSHLTSLSNQLNTVISSMGKNLNPSDGSIKMPKGKEWDQSIKALKHTIEDIKLDGMIDQLPKKDKDSIHDLMNNYNLDKASSYSLYKLQQSILKKAKKEHWNNEKIIFEYNRLVASCSYAMIPLKGKNSKNYQDFKLTNNSTYVSKRWQALCNTEEWPQAQKYLKAYGLSSEEAQHLKQAISLQHTLASDKYDNNNKLDFSHEAVQLACFPEQRTENTLFNNTLHILSHGINGGLEHDEISYKGDIDSGRIDKPDILSDIDAINMYRRMKDIKTDDIFNVSVNYHQAIKSGHINRVDEFYKNNSFGMNNKKIGKMNVQRKINTPTIGSIWIQGKEVKDLKTYQENKEEYESSLKTFESVMDEEEKRGLKND